MEQKDHHEFSLEDILREFGTHPEKQPTQIPQAEPEAAAPKSGKVSADTVPLGDLKGISTRALHTSSETIRLDDLKQADGPKNTPDSTTRFDPISTETAQHSAPKHASKTVAQAVHIYDEEEEPKTPVEPFSADWEPEYDEDVDGFAIPDPIIFRPKSRLKELRQKLVEGPEKRYYALLELGLGKLQLAIALCFAVFALSAGATILYECGVIPEERLRLLVFVQFLSMLLSALLGCYRMMEGVGDLFRLRFSMNSLLAITFVVCCVDGVLCLQQLRIPVCGAFSLEMVMSLWASMDKRNTETGQMDTLRRAINLDAIARVPNYYDGHPGYRQMRGEVEHFMDHYTAPATPERVLDGYAFGAFVAAAAIGVLAGVLHGFSAGVQLCAGALLAGMPASAFISVTRPMAILEKRLHKLGTVLCGWQGIKAVERRAAYPLEDGDLFPAGAAKLNGVKFYGDRKPDEVIAYATALIRENGGALVGLFRQLLDSRNGFQYKVSGLHHYSGGIGGEINDESVLVGTLEFMQDMGVDMGSGIRVSQAVYCAIDAELCGVFAINYGKAKSSAAGLRTLCGYRGLTPVVVCDDFMLTESFIRAKFGINTRRMAFPGRDVRQELVQREPEEDATVVALTTKEGLAPRAFAITGARVVKSASGTGVAIHMIGGILGLLIMSALAYIGARDLLTPTNLLLYELVWFIPGFLVTEWTRTI